MVNLYKGRLKLRGAVPLKSHIFAIISHYFQFSCCLLFANILCSNPDVYYRKVENFLMFKVIESATNSDF